MDNPEILRETPVLEQEARAIRAGSRLESRCNNLCDRNVLLQKYRSNGLGFGDFRPPIHANCPIERDLGHNGPRFPKNTGDCVQKGVASVPMVIRPREKTGLFEAEQSNAVS